MFTTIRAISSKLKCLFVGCDVSLGVYGVSAKGGEMWMPGKGREMLCVNRGLFPFRLKKKHPIDDLKTRMSCVKPFADVVFVIPDTDPTPYMKAAVPQVVCCFSKYCTALLTSGH